jgi:hypothetical protein
MLAGHNIYERKDVSRAAKKVEPTPHMDLIG